jgi:hypothetical protein
MSDDRTDTTGDGGDYCDCDSRTWGRGYVNYYYIRRSDAPYTYRIRRKQGDSRLRAMWRGLYAAAVLPWLRWQARHPKMEERA